MTVFSANALQRKGFAWITLLVLIDLITKIIALTFLDLSAPLDPDAWFQFVLRINKTGIGTWARAATGSLALADRALTGLMWLLAACAVLIGRQFQLSTGRQLAIAFLVAVVGKLILAPALPWLETLPTVLLAGFTKLGPAILFGLFWWSALRPLWRMTTIFICACAWGNLLCLALPPFGVVDFIYSSLASRFLRHGVFNLADFYFDLAVVTLTLFILQTIVGRFVPRFNATKGSKPS
jgi:lipoprotein signal peptidase